MAVVRPPRSSPRPSSRRSRQLLALGLAALLAGATACDRGTVEPPGASFRLAVRTGVTLDGPATGRLRGVPLLAVTDRTGEPVAGAKITVAGSGGVTIPDGTVATGPDGVARVDLILGGTPGTGRVSAVLVDNNQQSVTVTVTIGPAPTITTIAPSSFGVGDTITVQGTGWGAGTPITVVIGGVRARTLAASATSARVVVPACVDATLGAGGTVPVVAEVGDVAATAPVAAQLTTVGAALALRPYEAVTIAASEIGRCVALGGAASKYVIIPQFADGGETSGLNVLIPRPQGFLLSTGALDGPVVSREPAPVAVRAPSAQMMLDRRLRDQEARLAPLAAAAGPQPFGDIAPLSPQVTGSRRQFFVLGGLTGPELFNPIDARLLHAGDNVLLYVDEAAPAGGFSDAEYGRLGRLFDTKLYELGTRTFGMASDIDGDGRIIVLLSPAVNKLVPSPECIFSGSVTGYFYGRDLINLPNSNRTEIFYGLVPDPEGLSGGCQQGLDGVRRTLPGTFIHEFQHMISYNQHVLVRGGVQEADWLNEGLSHIAEEITSRTYELDPSQPRGTPEQLFPDSSQGYIVPNMLNAVDYLENPTVSSLTIFQSLGTLAERGAAWLFLRWLGDQKGEGIFRRLVETRSTGAANVQEQSGEPFARLFGDFSMTLYADLNPTVDRSRLDPRYRYTTRDFRVLLQRFADIGATGTPFPLNVKELPIGATISGSMVPGTMDFYELDAAAGPTRAALRFLSSGGNALPASLVPQVGILRIQ